MDGITPALQILTALRGAKGGRLQIAALLDPCYEGRIPNHTGAGIFGVAIARLFDTGFIELSPTKRKSIAMGVSSIGDRGDWGLGRGYKIAAELRGQEGHIEVRLTDRLVELQSALGISISRTLEDRDDKWLRICPIFGKPSKIPLQDVFVLMPFLPEMLPIYTDHIKKVCNDLNIGCKRADDIFSSSRIIDDIWALIAHSKLLIADCTGRNPNVFYELGIAHTIGKQVIIITQDELDIPFDIRHIRYIKYRYTPLGMKEFESTLENFLTHEYRPEREFAVPTASRTAPV